MYQHPSLSNCKSRIDYIFLPNVMAVSYNQTAHYMSFSDHQVVHAFVLPKKEKGPGVWQCAVDVIADCDAEIRNIIHDMYQKEGDPCLVWEQTKLACQASLSNAMAFHCKQHDIESFKTITS